MEAKENAGVAAVYLPWSPMPNDVRYKVHLPQIRLMDHMLTDLTSMTTQAVSDRSCQLSGQDILKCMEEPAAALRHRAIRKMRVERKRQKTPQSQMKDVSSAVSNGSKLATSWPAEKGEKPSSAEGPADHVMVCVGARDGAASFFVNQVASALSESQSAASMKCKHQRGDAPSPASSPVSPSTATAALGSRRPPVARTAAQKIRREAESRSKQEGQTAGLAVGSVEVSHKRRRKTTSNRRPRHTSSSDQEAAPSNLPDAPLASSSHSTTSSSSGSPAAGAKKRFVEDDVAQIYFI